jgi:hypothetical protein
MIEPLAFTAAVMACIWMFHGHMAIPIALLTVWVLITWIRRRETISSLGLSMTAAVRCFYRWRLLFLALVLLVAVAAGPGMLSSTMLWHAFRYLLWCVVQQAVYQSMVFRPVQYATGRTAAAAMISGALFALVHLPNPVLVPATFVWGTCACLLFAGCRSVIALGGVQFLLSAAGVALIPVSLHHGFRIGPGY